MAKAERHIGLSLGLIGSLGDGLGEFSTHLCERVAAVAPAWQRDHGVRFHIHMAKRFHGHFGPDVGYLEAKRSQGYLHWQPGLPFDCWHGLNQLGRIVPPIGTRHALMTIHDLNMIYHDPPDKAERELNKLRRRLRSFDAVTTQTNYVADDIRKHLGWQGDITLIPSAARDFTSHPQTPVGGVPDKDFLMTLSRLSPWKNPRSLVELAAHWPERTIVLAGPRTHESEALEAEARERGLKNLLLVRGVDNAQKSWLYAHCRGFLFPSLTEGFGLPPLEAMHFGKPVYLSRLTCLPEVGGDFAAYFDSFEPQAMREVIEREEPKLEARADEIRAHSASFNWDRSALGYLALYEQALGIA